jgi:light-regulated signal transduction histidine kinase (bacteriophytochrome)
LCGLIGLGGTRIEILTGCHLFRNFVKHCYLYGVTLKCARVHAAPDKGASINENAIVTSGRLPNVPAYRGNSQPLFQNLIGNAIKYRSARPPRIHVSVQEVNGERRFSVSDNGIGIDPEYQNQIFEVFRRLPGRKIPGTGVGPAILLAQA